MEIRELIKSVAPCGLVCGVCPAVEKRGCVGCKNGGGDASECYKRQCSAEKQLSGCWECDTFPCDKGFPEEPASDGFRGLFVGKVLAVQELGIESYVHRVITRMGVPVEYGNWQHEAPEDVKRLLCDIP